jgi:DNA repair protein RadD
VPPHFGFPPSDELHYDYSGCEVSKDTGDYVESDLERIADEQSEKLTPIMREVVERTRDRNVVLIFAASKRHCDQIAAHLPKNETAIITADTKLEHRRAYIRAAREYRPDDPSAGIVKTDKGEPLFDGTHRVKYLINCGTLTTGVNIPTIDVVVYLRAVGSLVLLIQSIGRGLRLMEEVAKRDCLVLDYAEVMARLGGLYNSPILEQAELERSEGLGTTKACPKCNTINGEYARRCMGEDANSMDGRCEHFWQSNECPACGTHNDVTARECRQCGGELKDPNEKLTGKAYTDADLKPVLRREFAPVKNGECLMITYTLDIGNGQTESAKEFFWPGSQKQMAKRLWKLWVIDHVRDRNWQGLAISMRSAKAVCSGQAMFDCPTHITHRINDKGRSIIHRRVFRSGREVNGGKP